MTSGLRLSATELAAIEDEFRGMTFGLDQELAAVWPVRGAGVDRPVLASVGSDREALGFDVSLCDTRSS